ncbi:hypothetical protein GUJ93_ZPchr0001g30965 [Zizania palustris]|uniref:Uncharacterized protein n=1 Tax=Zizania palustris TaxID=103762 RepID=A0A8J5RGP2_ZIZPA|nr:hypothetical protein GUJ93_ZPchr0001g30965 [Zizania palustris]
MEVEVEGELTWQGLFLRRVVMAEAHCHTLHGLLRGPIEALIEEPRDVVAGAEEARRKLEDASTELGLGIANIGAARHLALWCGAPSGRAPLPSVDDLADPHMRSSLDRLQKAAEIATRVHDRLESAHGHLSAAEFLMALTVDGGEGNAPWVHDPCVSKQIDGLMELSEALFLAVDLVSLTAAAKEAVFAVY